MHWCNHNCLQRLHHLMLPSESTRTNSYSVCAQGRQLWQYLVRTACQTPRAMCDVAPRAESISEIHSSLSLIGLDARAAKWENRRWQCFFKKLFRISKQEAFHCFLNCFMGCSCPSFLYFLVDSCIPICPLCMGHLQEPLHESSSPEVCPSCKVCRLDMLCSMLYP